MKTLTKIIATGLLVCSLLTSAQQFSFENINSNNVLNLLSELSIASENQRNSEVNMIQYGNENFAEIRTNSQTQLTALQFGDYNYLNFDNSFSKDKTFFLISNSSFVLFSAIF